MISHTPIALDSETGLIGSLITLTHRNLIFSTGLTVNVPRAYTIHWCIINVLSGYRSDSSRRLVQRQVVRAILVPNPTLYSAHD